MSSKQLAGVVGWVTKRSLDPIFAVFSSLHEIFDHHPAIASFSLFKYHVSFGMKRENKGDPQ